MSLKFTELASLYPRGGRAELFENLGGEWPSLIHNPNFSNTCAIRMSIAFNKAGLPIPKLKREAIDGAGHGLIIKVDSLIAFINEVISDQSWGMSRTPGSDFSATVIPIYTGIIFYRAKWQNASGHVDLWNGTGFISSGNVSDIKEGFEIGLWRID